MPWGRAGGQNIEHPHILEILSSFFLLQMHLVLLVRRSSGELPYSGTSLIHKGNFTCRHNFYFRSVVTRDC